jgi:hypothetical protein
LAALHRDDELAELSTIEIAADSPAEHPVRYDDLVQVMDVAVAAGFTRPALLQPHALSWQPAL